MNAIDLLRQFRERRSENAFAELVRRYASLVYSVARRRLDNSALAEEASQNVFIRLASSPPSLPNDAALLGWLHRTTLHVSIDLWRAESRRLAREQKAAAMQPANSTESVWADLAPVLDEALDELPEPDRATLLLRFFEDRKMRELGEVLGISEDAAKMRVGRSLDRLRERLAHRGITTSAAALGVMLAENVSIAAPAALVAALLKPAPILAPAAASWLAPLLRPQLALIVFLAALVPTALLLRPGASRSSTERAAPTVAEAAKAASAAPHAQDENQPGAAVRDPDPRALLEGIIRARQRITSGVMEIELLQDHFASAKRETNVIQLRIEFDGSKRRFEETLVDYGYVGINEEGERSARTMEEKKLTRAEAVRAGLLKAFDSRTVSSYDGTVLLEYWETDGKPDGTTIKDPEKGSFSRHLFDPRLFGLSTYYRSSLQDSLALGCAEDIKLLGQEIVEGAAAWHIQVRCAHYQPEFWVSIDRPERLLKRTTGNETMLLRYAGAPATDPLPTEVVVLREHRAQNLTSRFIRKSTDYNVLLDPDFCSMQNLGMKVGTSVVDYRTSRSLGYWTGSGLSQELPGANQEPAADIPKLADLLHTLEHQPDSPEGLDAALWIIQNTPDGDEVEKASRAILDHHLQSTNLVSLAERFEELRHRCAKPILKALLAQNPDPETRAVACLSLGLTALEEAKFGENKEATRDAKTYLRRVLNEFMKTKKGFARHHYAERGLERIDRFFIGKRAPRLQATTVVGEPLDTAELNGQTLVLFFFHHYSSDGYEHRKIFEKFAGKPVTFIGVSCLDKLERTLATIEENKLPWPIVHDGNHGPLAESWLIDSWTSTFVIDRRGIIRARDERGPELVKAIESGLR